MKYDPKDDMLAEGEYEAVVESAWDAVSKGGNEMVELEVAAYRQDGEKFIIKDWLLSMRGSTWKLRHFCDSAGLNFESGEVMAKDCEGKNVRVKVTQATDERFGTQNRIVDYLKRNGAAIVVEKDADVPF